MGGWRERSLTHKQSDRCQHHSKAVKNCLEKSLDISGTDFSIAHYFLKTALSVKIFYSNRSSPPPRGKLA